MVTDLAIGPGSRVSLHFTLRLQRNAWIAETTSGEEPMRLTLGDGTLHAGLEAVLRGLKAGDARRFQLAPDTCGVRDPQNIHQLGRDQFADHAELEPGKLVAFDLPNGETIPGLITAVSNATVTVDFNHPLAGEALDFEVEILEVQSPQAGQE